MSSNVQARFTVEDDAHVMVGHLAGDGYVRILYPTSALTTTRVAKGKSYTTENVFARHDALPSLYSARTVLYRHISARMDSYDGAGNGYFFLVASRYPLNFDEISANGLFDEIEVPNYFDTFDPRLTVKALADLVADNRPYTLEFARSYRTVDYSSFIDRRMDCLMLEMFDFSYSVYQMSRLSYSSPFTINSLRDVMGLRGCSGYSYAFAPFRSRFYATSYTPATVLPTPPRVDRPRGSIGSPWQRRAIPSPRSPRASASNAYLPERITARRAENAWHRRTGSARPRHDALDDDRRRARTVMTGSGAATRSSDARPAERAADRTPAERSPARASDRSAPQPSSAPRGEKKDP